MRYQPLPTDVEVTDPLPAVTVGVGTPEDHAILIAIAVLLVLICIRLLYCEYVCTDAHTQTATHTATSTSTYTKTCTYKPTIYAFVSGTDTLNMYLHSNFKYMRIRLR